MIINWTEWKAMPAPEDFRLISGPIGPGAYQIMNKQTQELIQFGEGTECQKRMKSLYPKPYGVGTRNNENKRLYILENWRNLVYRTTAANTKAEAVTIDRYLKSFNNHKFNT